MGENFHELVENEIFTEKSWCLLLRGVRETGFHCMDYELGTGGRGGRGKRGRRGGRGGRGGRERKGEEGGREKGGGRGKGEGGRGKGRRGGKGGREGGEEERKGRMGREDGKGGEDTIILLLFSFSLCRLSLVQLALLRLPL